MKFTKSKIASLPTPTEKGQVFYWGSGMRGFGLRITSAGAKSWVVQGRVNKKTCRYTRGTVDRMELKEAWTLASEVLRGMDAGKDPHAEKQKQKLMGQSETLREVMEDYILHKRTKSGPLRPRRYVPATGAGRRMGSAGKSDAEDTERQCGQR